MPAAWENVVPFWNHSELEYVNQLARDANALIDTPFPNAEKLPDDNGERFFSEHLTITMTRQAARKNNELGICICDECCGTKIQQRKTQSPSQQTKNVVVHRQCEKVGLAPVVEKPKQRLIPASKTMTGAPNAYTNFAALHHLQAMPLFPYITTQFPPIYYIANPSCCSKYHHWLSVRRGRPPHDAQCHYRQQQQHEQTVKMILKNEPYEQEQKEEGRDKKL